MSDKLTPQEEQLVANLKETHVLHLPLIYSIARYHEKFRFAKLVLAELTSRGLSNKEVFDFDSNFSNFYDSLINSTSL